MASKRWGRTGPRGVTAGDAQSDDAPPESGAKPHRGIAGRIRAHPIRSSVIGIVTLLIVLIGIGVAVGDNNNGASGPPAPHQPTTTAAHPTSTPPTPTPSPTPTPPPTPTPSPTPPTSPAPPRSPTRPTASPSPAPVTALGVLATLPVKGRAPKTGYTRAQFGEAWTDDVNVPDGRNGCDTRNDILRRDLTDITRKPNTNGCVVATGKLADPYTATLITYVRGIATSSAVQIDHVVALSDAWQKGAQQLTLQRRTDFANDPLELLAVEGAVNQQKGDGDAATWLPPNKAYRCPYVARQIAVKRKYHLWVTAAEKAAMDRVLSICPGQRVPTEVQPPRRIQPTATKAPPPVTSPRPVPPPAPGGEVYYKNCAEVRAAGKAPLHRGQPGYRPGLDRDGDGIACE